ncbi:hypothetical protein H2201_008782 [Coniosporium apollinis]|uniref:SWIRM domain-containing protein n=1 Tax=Coniosporium apollinis TaxID=61459 RepID=A0ABQ9NG34_9PEZI|nr:hypothetical protein H2201_008782 [Coniosporium apollinis]
MHGDSFHSPTSQMLSRSPLSSFSSESAPTRMQSVFCQSSPRGLDSKQSLLLPPPISPLATEEKDNVRGPGENDDLDPPLFDSDGSTVEDMPLFPSEHVDPQHEATVSQYINRNRGNDPTSRPTKEEYLLFISTVAKNYNNDPQAWLRRQREILSMYQPFRVVKPSAPTNGLRRLAPAPSSGPRKSKPVVAIPHIPRARRQKRTPQVQVWDSFEQTSSPTPKGPRPAVNRDDVYYRSLPDYSPNAFTTLPDNNKSLKADWKGRMLDLSTDPDKHMLHPAEVNLAATLRLSCATYLCSKRRIFMARMDAMCIGKEFRKTGAQQACRIDVNKVSKLWSAFDRVGWFDKKFFVSIFDNLYATSRARSDG